MLDEKSSVHSWTGQMLMIASDATLDEGEEGRLLD